MTTDKKRTGLEFLSQFFSAAGAQIFDLHKDLSFYTFIMIWSSSVTPLRGLHDLR